VRLDKLYEILGECRFGIHDLSRTTLDTRSQLPRFNMPLELGIFLGAKRYGGASQAKKSCLILDRDQYRYQIFARISRGRTSVLTTTTLVRRSMGFEIGCALPAQAVSASLVRNACRNGTSSSGSNCPRCAVLRVSRSAISLFSISERS